MELQINSVIGSFFIKDQLLLQKENDTYTILMARIPQFRFLIRWRLITGMDFPARTAELDTPVEGMTVTYSMGLRASWD